MSPPSDSGDSFNPSDGTRTRLRKMVGSIGNALAGHDVLEAFSALVKELDLGPEPVMLACPKCSALGHRTATRCGHCWARLG